MRRLERSAAGISLSLRGHAEAVGALILFVLTLGLVGRTPGYVVIAERREAPDAVAGEADGGRRRLAGVGVMVNGRRQYVHAECVSADWPREDPAPRGRDGADV